ASLAGLVAITAPCDVCDAFGAIVIGAVAGLLVVFGVWLLDNVLRVDDPVGAVAVHCLNGIWGTIAVGLFATPAAPAFARGIGDGGSYGANQIAGAGLFYGGGFRQLGIQFAGMSATAAWTAVTITVAFLAIRMIFGLRASEEDEILGLDSTEHGLPSAYAGFQIVDLSTGMQINENTDLGEDSYESASEFKKNAAVPVIQSEPVDHESSTGMYKVAIIAKHSRYEKLKNALNDLGVTGMTVTQVMGCGIQKGAGERYRGVELDVNVLPKMKVEVIIGNIPVDKVIETAKKALYTGHIGDGKIFVYNVQRVIKVRTGEEDLAALNDVE
ncbi:MAG: adenylate cyclase, partial [Lachnospiraceae bacterium]|nr:adenylate cyclase [Lachnospiraceae bacterium]